MASRMSGKVSSKVPSKSKIKALYIHGSFLFKQRGGLIRSPPHRVISIAPSLFLQIVESRTIRHVSGVEQLFSLLRAVATEIVFIEPDDIGVIMGLTDHALLIDRIEDDRAFGPIGIEDVGVF